MKLFVSSVQNPTISVSRVTVSGANASAVVLAGASGQKAALEKIELVADQTGLAPGFAGFAAVSTRLSARSTRRAGSRLGPQQSEGDDVLATLVVGQVGAQDRLTGEAAPLCHVLGGGVAGSGQEVDSLQVERSKSPVADEPDRPAWHGRRRVRRRLASSPPRPGRAPRRNA